ncbi:hypothetical protein UMZ34_15760 [Halopseudomonas pachastrellae]|nr:hypothetical protein UMZ34_15760 [Halopseudomonas pachastrellae]
MIRGIGTDLVLVSRIEAVLTRQGERFARRILTADELSALPPTDGLRAIWPSALPPKRRF